MADLPVALANLGGSACVKKKKIYINVQQTRKEEFYNIEMYLISDRM